MVVCVNLADGADGHVNVLRGAGLASIGNNDIHALAGVGDGGLLAALGLGTPWVVLGEGDFEVGVLFSIRWAGPCSGARDGVKGLEKRGRDSR